MNEVKRQPPVKREPFRGYWNYEVMLYRGDELVDQGRIRDIAERRGILKASVYYYLTPVAYRRADERKDKVRYGLRAVRVGAWTGK